MKKLLTCALCAVVLLFASCNKPVEGSQDGSSDISQTTTALTTTASSTTAPITTDPSENISKALKELGSPDNTYFCHDYSKLISFKGKTESDFERMCEYYQHLGYEFYNESERNGSRFATLVDSSLLAHIYWFKSTGELNIITSSVAGYTLPPVVPETVTGSYTTTVTQVHDPNHNNGMGYIVQLADGSFIIFDGSYANQVTQVYNTLCELNGGPEGIRIRAWLLTHSHSDHYPCFAAFASAYGKSVELEYVLVAPVNKDVAADTYLNVGINTDIGRFDGAVLVTVHTGMEFTFCNLNLEILFAADDLYKNSKPENFNNSSLVSRLYTEDYSFLILGDSAKEAGAIMSGVYGDYLKSDMCQMSHHGVEDMPLSFYRLVEPSILFYPCNQALYDLPSRSGDVRKALARSATTKEILIAGNDQYTRAWNN